MAGIGVKLNKIYNKNTLTTNIIGMGYSTMITIAPMILVIAAIMAMQVLLDVSKVGYAQRELFACTVLYIFIFSLLSAGSSWTPATPRAAPIWWSRWRWPPWPPGPMDCCGGP